MVEPIPFSFQLACIVKGESRIHYNPLYFATEDECLEHGQELRSRWPGLESYAAVVSHHPVSHRWLDSRRRAVPIQRLEWACLTCHRTWPYDSAPTDHPSFCPECGQQPILREGIK